MFKPKTRKISKLAQQYSKVIQELESIFDNKTNVYIDFANVIGWQEKLNWHVDLKRLKQLLDSFDTINSIKFYNGTLIGSKESENFMKDIEKMKYEVRTKPVKIMQLSIDVSSIPINSPILLESFIRKPLLDKFSLETIEYLNKRLKELNDNGIKFVKDKKCNFDVEIGRNMLIDYEKNNIKNFVLWSGDSDFENPVNQLLKDKRKVVIFATVRRISTELANTKARIFEIKKIKEFICWPRESQKDPLQGP